MDSSDATTVFRRTKKSTFDIDLRTGLYDLVSYVKTHTSETESMIKKDIADSLHWFAEMAKCVKCIVLVGTNILVEGYGGIESNLADKVATIKNMEETFRLRDGKGALDYSEEAQQSRKTDAKPQSGGTTAGPSATTKAPSG
ncbi:hypothetical protein LTR85_011271 [Meristemomyces frigidus]|nr:hypothetical protein LTR85_011271 [Meristemomyces frigidus]